MKPDQTLVKEHFVFRLVRISAIFIGFIISMFIGLLVGHVLIVNAYSWLDYAPDYMNQPVEESAIDALVSHLRSQAISITGFLFLMVGIVFTRRR